MLLHPTIASKKDVSQTNRAVEWHGKQDVRVVDRPKPLVTDPKDVLVHVTSTTICGSDLHLYHQEFPGMKVGDVLGHEFMGIVEDVGPEVTTLAVGDRVVVSAVISDGTCDYCKQGLFSCCDTTNPSKEMEDMYGHRTAGIFGYSHLTGGYEGGQAEWVRVPYGDVNCLKIPENLRDEKVLFLSDILCTGWHATELAQVKEGDVVAVWGLGPVGLMACMWAKYKKAAKVIGVDCIPERLQMAQERLAIDVVDFGQEDVVETIKVLVPGGPDCCIDAVGFRFPKSLSHWIQRKLLLETDSPEVLDEMIKTVRKGGRIGIVGEYLAYANRFPIGAFMEKGLYMAGGLVHVQQYWKHLLEIIQRSEVDPTFVITNRMGLERAEEAYRMFDKKESGTMKIILKPSWTQELPPQH